MILTEKDAWILLAGLWADAQETETGVWAAECCGYKNLGICPCITDLERAGKISYTTRQSMMRKIMSGWKPIYDNWYGRFRWDPDQHGARQRSLFCSEQAEKL